MKNKVLIIGFVWPEPTSSAAGIRMMQLIKSFVANGDEVVFATQALESDFAFDLKSLGIQTFKIEVNDSSFDTFVSSLNPTIVLFDRFIMEEQFGWRVSENCPNALRILDTEDLHFLRKERQQLVQNKELGTFSDIAKREIAAIYRCDFTLIISTFEKELLETKYQVPTERLLYLPMWSESSTACNSFDERSHFIFVGNFMHEPNWDAVRYLKKEIWPFIHKQIPQAELHIYGAYPTDKVFQLTNEKEGFIIKGRAENVDVVCQQYRVMLAPLRFGAGVKGKFIDAMRNGLPSVTTTIGAESMVNRANWPGFVCDEVGEMISSAVKIYQDQSEWDRYSKEALKLHTETYLEKDWTVTFLNTISQYQSNLEGVRERNFTGAMLMHQIHQGTKYMSKWIELKNKN